MSQKRNAHVFVPQGDDVLTEVPESITEQVVSDLFEEHFNPNKFKEQDDEQV